MFSSRLMSGAAVWVLAMGMSVPAYTQAVSSSIRGEVISTETGDGVAGASVEIVDTRTNAKTSKPSSEGGAFNASGLEVGGPYTVRVTAPGYKPREVTGVFIRLGEPTQVLVDVTPEKAANEKVTVVGQRNRKIDSRGIATSYNRESIESQPTVANDIKEVLQQSPLVAVDGVGGPRGVGRTRIAGSNPRCNSFNVDGLPQNDNFGLNDNGYPTQRAPLPLQWAKQIQLAVTPYNVEYNDFCGGVINAITKSGENEWHGGAYGTFANDGFQGKDLGNGTSPRKTFFEEKNYGYYAGGALIPDTLFVFGGYDITTNKSAGQSYGVPGSGAASIIPNVSQADVDAVRNIAQTVYGYQAGDVAAGNPVQQTQRAFGKVTWQVNDDHRVQVGVQRATGSDNRSGVSPGGGSLVSGISNTGNTISVLPLSSVNYAQFQKMDAISAQLNSNWTSDFSTEFRLGRVNIGTLPTPVGAPFAQVAVRTAGADGNYATAGDNGYVVFGNDQFRHANVLRTQFDIAKLTGTYQLDDHVLLGGVEHKRVQIFNLFVEGSRGLYRFDSITNFQNGIVGTGVDGNLRPGRGSDPIRYQNSPDNIVENGAASWGYKVNTIYLQDDWTITPELSAMFGLRYDAFVADGAIRQNNEFQSAYGFTNTTDLEGLDIILPRFSFAYDPEWAAEYGIGLRVRGGLGRFSGGSPNVWVSNGFTNNGFGVVQIQGNPGAGGLPAANFIAQPGPNGADFDLSTVPGFLTTQLSTLGGGAGLGTVNALSPDFKIPSIWRANLGADVELEGYRLSFDVLKMKAWDQIHYASLRMVRDNATNGGLAPDGRILYDDIQTVVGGGIPALRPNTNDLIVRNADKGEGLFFVVGVDKSFEFEDVPLKIDLNVGYTYSDVKDMGGQTSSTASSNFGNRTYINMNEPELWRSDNERRNRYTYGASFSYNWFDWMTSRVRLFGQTTSGQPFSYVFGTNTANRNPFQDSFNVPNKTFADNDPGGLLVYVPQADASGVVTAASDPRVRYAGGFDFAGFNQVLNDTGLIQYQGQIAPRNEFFGPDVTRIDLGFEQAVDVGVGPVTFEFNIFNFGNLLNSKWGLYEQASFPQAKSVVITRYDRVTNQYVFQSFLTPAANAVDQPASLWQMQVGVRYEF